MQVKKLNVFELFAKISLDSSGFESGLKKAGRVAGTALTGATMAIVAGTAIITKKLIDGAKQTADYGDHVDKMSQKIGISAESYQKWDYVMQRAGGNVDSLKMGMKTLSQQAEKNSDAFQKLGISQEQVASMSQEQLFEATVKGLSSMEASTERAALASELLGRAGADMGPLLNQGTDAIEEQMEIAEKYGMIMPDSAVKASAAFKDSITTMQMTLTGLKNRMMGEFLPAMTQVTDGLAKLFAGDMSGAEDIGNGITEVVNKISEVLPKMVEIGGTILKSLGNAIMKNIPTLIPVMTQVILGIGKFIISALPQLINAGMQLLTALGQGIIQNLPQIIQAGIQVMQTLITGLLQAIPQLISGAATIITTLASGISQALPILIPAVVEIILSIVEALIDNIDAVIDAAIEIIMAIADGLIQALPILIQKAPQIIAKLAQAIITNAPKLLSAGIQLVVTLVSGIGSAISQVISAGAQLLRSLVTSIGQGVSQMLAKGKELVSNFVQGIKNFFGNVRSVGSQIIDSVKGGITSKISQALSWGKDLMSNFIKGIKGKIGELGGVLSGIGSKVKSLIGHSHPTEGPMKDDYTWMPDMMDLFIKGIKDNEKRLVAQARKTFDLRNAIHGGLNLSAAGGNGALANAGSAGGNSYTFNIYATPNQSTREIANAVQRILIQEEKNRRSAWA